MLRAQEALGVPGHVMFEECSGEVGDALGPDVMKSVKHLIPDVLASLPLLLYQGGAWRNLCHICIWAPLQHCAMHGMMSPAVPPAKHPDNHACRRGGCPGWPCEQRALDT